jgi:4-diphosphocytidyl-2-C-methyl-D-erythritol kinase
VRRIPATAKINLALVVGRRRSDGKHEVATVLQRIDLVDRVSIEAGPRLAVSGFPEDTLVRAALLALAEEGGVEANWAVRIEKRIPVAAGLGGGSSDAAAALRLANDTLAEPVPAERLHALAAGIGSDVPFFLAQGPQLANGDGTELSSVDLPQDFWIVLVLPTGTAKSSTAQVYEAYEGAAGFAQRKAELTKALAMTRRPGDLAALPANDLASSPLADELRELGAFRAEVTGAGPTVYGLFVRRERAESARRAVATRGRTWLTVPTWYG